MHFPIGAGVRFPGPSIKARFCFICISVALLQFFTVLKCGTLGIESSTTLRQKMSPIQPRPPGGVVR